MGLRLKEMLAEKMRFFVNIYQQTLQNPDFSDRFQIKWDRELTKYWERSIDKTFEERQIVSSLYRPFVRMHLYFDRHFNGMTYQNFNIFPEKEAANFVIAISGLASSKPFQSLVSDRIVCLDALEKTQCLLLYRYTERGERVENITDWALEQFRARYGRRPSPQPSPTGSGSQLESSPQPSPTGSGSSSDSPLPLGEGLGVRADSNGPEAEGPEARADSTHPQDEIPEVKVKPALPPQLLARARELRQNATDAEKLLWKLLRNRQLGGAKFRRQHPFGPYILDFYCHQSQLAIELDGGGHAEPEQARYDAERTQALEAEGLRVLRFWNNDVLQNTEGVLETILGALEPSPQPSPSGRGSSSDTPLPLGEGLGVRADSHRLQDKGPEVREITKRDIFHYVYAVLHHPAYREKYKLNLKREFPRIPFYDDFWKWADWGRQLMELHLNYETVEPYPLERIDKDPDEVRKAYKAKLKAVKGKGIIELDTLTTLGGIPEAAWDYRLGNRSALEWILDRYKERKPRDPTIRDKFNTYQFSDYKEQVIDLLRRVTTVSVQTMAVIAQMDEVEVTQ